MWLCCPLRRMKETSHEKNTHHEFVGERKEFRFCLTGLFNFPACSNLPCVLFQEAAVSLSPPLCVVPRSCCLSLTFCSLFQKAALLQLEKDIRTANIKFDETLSCFSLMEAQQLSASNIFLPETQVSLCVKPF